MRAREHLLVFRKHEQRIERADVDAVLAVLFDIRSELIEIRIILGEEDGEEREDS
jgi:hypothetical protein